MNRDILKLMTVLKRAAKYPDRFSDAEREAMVKLLAVYVESPDPRIASRAVEALVAMIGFDADAERLHLQQVVH